MSGQGKKDVTVRVSAERIALHRKEDLGPPSQADASSGLPVSDEDAKSTMLRLKDQEIDLNERRDKREERHLKVLEVESAQAVAARRLLYRICASTAILAFLALVLIAIGCIELHENIVVAMIGVVGLLGWRSTKSGSVNP